MSDVSYPKDWSYGRLASFSNFIGRGVGPKYSDEPTAIVAINQKCVRDGKVTSAFGRFHDESVEVRATSMLTHCDVCINSTGDGTIGRVGLWRKTSDEIECFVDSHVTIVRPKPEELNPKYASELLSSSWVQNDLERYCFTGSTNQIELSRTELLDLKIAFPTLSAQQKIAKILTVVDKLIEKTQALIDKYTAIKQGMMADLFTCGIDLSGTPDTNPNYGQLRPSYEQAPELYKQTELGWVSKEWEVVPQGEVITLMTNGFVGVATPHYANNDGGVRYLYGNNVRANRLELDRVLRIKEGFHKRLRKSQLQRGDMLTVQSGHIGTSAVVPEKFGEANCHALIITRFIQSKVVPEFVSYYCNSALGMNRMEEIFVGSTIKHVNVKEFKEYLLPLPSMEEQSQFIERIASIENLLETESRQLEKSIKIKKGLMQDLLTGKVRVN